MKFAQLTAALIAAAVMVPVFADGTAATTPEPTAATPESTAASLMNPATMAEPAKEPETAVNTIIMLMDPATLMAMMTRGMNPATYTQMGQAAMNPATAQSYAQFMDPNLYAKWMAASMNPNFYTAMAAPLMNPNTYMKWGMAPMDPRMMGAGMQMMNPGMYADWVTPPMTVPSYQAMPHPIAMRLDNYAQHVSDALRNALNDKNKTAIDAAFSEADKTLDNNNIGNAERRRFWANVREAAMPGQFWLVDQDNNSLIALMQAIQNALAARQAK